MKNRRSGIGGALRRGKSKVARREERIVRCDGVVGAANKERC
jgi:hypothetical protein